MTKLSSLSSAIRQFRQQHPNTFKYPVPQEMKTKVLDLLDQHSQAEIAKEIGVPYGTITNWRYAAKKENKNHSDPGKTRQTTLSTELIPLGTFESLKNIDSSTTQHEIEINDGSHRHLRLKFNKDDQVAMTLFFQTLIQSL